MQTTIQKTSKERSAIRVPQPNRKDIRRRTRGQQQHIGHRSIRKGVAPFSNFGFPDLKDQARPLSEYQVDLHRGREIEFLHDKELHLVVVAGLYPIIQKHPNFQDRNDWCKSTDVREILIWLIDQMNRFVDSKNNWVLTKLNDEQEYSVIIYHEYDTGETGYYAIPLSFLPDLEARNEQLHEIVVDLLALLKSKAGINGWYDQWGEWAMDWLLEEYYMRLRDGDFNEDEELKTHWEHTIHEHTEGTAIHYEGLLTGNNTTIQQLEMKVSRFKPADQLDHSFYDWILDGIDLVHTNKSLQYFSFDPSDPNLLGENPIMPVSYCFYTWDFDNQFHKCMEEQLNCTWQEFGASPFTSCEIIRQEDKLFKLPEVSDFPKRLTEFMLTGCELSKLILNHNN